LAAEHQENILKKSILNWSCIPSMA